MSNRDSRSKGLKVVYKHDADTIMPQRISSHDNAWAAGESWFDMIARLWKGFNHFKAALLHQFERRTYGIFERKRVVVILKVCILGIIMLFILKRDIALDVKMANFAGQKTSTERKYTDKHNKDYAVQASMGAVVNDLSPASPEELRESQVRNYIEQFSNAAVSEMDKYGIPASISMAQAIIESRSGTSILAVKNNNHFGIKCFSKTCPKGHCSNFTDDHHKDFFRRYGNSIDSWKEHSNFLMKNSYRKLLKFGKDYRAWARGLRDYGYATDSQYDIKLISVIERYELNRLDDL